MFPRASDNRRSKLQTFSAYSASIPTPETTRTRLAQTSVTKENRCFFLLNLKRKSHRAFFENKTRNSCLRSSTNHTTRIRFHSFRSLRLFPQTKKYNMGDKLLTASFSTGNPFRLGKSRQKQRATICNCKLCRQPDLAVKVSYVAILGDNLP